MKLHFVIAFGIQLAFFIPLSLNRIIAGDEGFYLIAAREVTYGALPYLDFFYPQMPFLPFVYGGWMEVFGASWKSARIFAALMSAAIGWLLFLRVATLYGIRWGYLSLCLFSTSQFVFPWYLIAKSYSLSTLLLFGSYVVFVNRLSMPTKLQYALAGLLLGLAVNTRLYFGATLIVFGLSCIRLPRGERGTALFSFFTGTGVTFIPDIYFLLVAFDSFWFSNIGYHLLRSSLSLARSFRQKRTILLTIIGARSTSKFTGVQFPMVMVLSHLGMLGMFFRKQEVDLALYIALVLIFTSFVPTPSYVQYFCVVLPFLLLGLVWLLREMMRTRGMLRVANVVICVGLAIQYFGVVPADVYKYTVSGRGVLSLLTPKEAKSLPAMRRIADAINEVTDPGDRVLTTWPGVLVGSHARPYRGLENHFGLKSGHKVPASERERLHIMSKNDLWRTLKRGDAETVVLDRKAFKGQYREALTKYELVNATKYYVVLQRS